MAIHRRHPLVGRVRVAGRLQVAGNADQSDDLFVAIENRALVRDAPAGLAAAEQMQFQLLFQRDAESQDAFVLFRIGGPSCSGKTSALVLPNRKSSRLTPQRCTSVRLANR